MDNRKFMDTMTRRYPERKDERKMVPLPEVPQTASPVPWLTSIHGRPGRGDYGDARYRGNCSGLLIKDLLCFYRPNRVLDPMEGGGTCRDVCDELGIEYVGRDLKDGFDAMDPGKFRALGQFDFIWLHPPYWKMVSYNPDDIRCLANAQNVDDFLRQLTEVLTNCRSALAPNGHVAMLIGDVREHGTYQALPFYAFYAAVNAGFWLAAPEIVRFQHGASSSKKAYSTAFIPRLHDLCFVLKPGKQS